MRDPEPNLLFEMLSNALLPHPSGECRCNFPGTIVACTRDALHDGDHEAPPIQLVDGSMSDPVRWPQTRPVEAPDA